MQLLLLIIIIIIVTKFPVSYYGPGSHATLAWLDSV